MHTRTEEEYIFWNLAWQDMVYAREFAGLAAQAKDLTRFALLSTAVISYARPFTECRGKFGPGRNDGYWLDKAILPVGAFADHKTAMDWRNKALAHTDINLREPMLHCWRSDSGPEFHAVMKGWYSEALLSPDKVLALVAHVFSWVEPQIHKRKQDMAEAIKNAPPGPGRFDV